ncbi:hypothetical protein ONZ51_g2788 [Trametes cubensis]|uniref:Ser-Thr-rich glycosyl-phosphatidyl-inositol-anchored membrane family-domain-containing protein n=1 Tax=Trametes cubensis TaxID=1111947 RepID=A0AAD7TZJ2_9APHY|nr:hypothetical protein ONZ51_g2788 [Trametes cubensis]
MLPRVDLAALLLVVLVLRCSSADPLFQPTILSPNSTDVWNVGDVRTVRWSNHDLDIPPNKHGEIVLGYSTPGTNLDNAYYQQPLADGFLISDQVVNVVVPAVPSGDFYFIVINGDANAQTTYFTIVNPASPAGPSSANITLTATISISSAPPATVSHWSLGGKSSSQTATSGQKTSTTASAPSSATTPNGAQPRAVAAGWNWFKVAVTTVVAVTIMLDA